MRVHVVSDPEAVRPGHRVLDVLCRHIPPTLPLLTDDTVARRHEVGSAALLAYVREHEPLPRDPTAVGAGVVRTAGRPTG
ncbi:MAG: hypothetical protein ACYCYA_06250 [Actinomycetes bacterium]